MDNKWTSQLHKKTRHAIQTNGENQTHQPIILSKKDKLQQHKSLLNKLIRKTKKDYYTEQFLKFSNDCKNTWKLLNQVAGRKQIKKLTQDV